MGTGMRAAMQETIQGIFRTTAKTSLTATAMRQTYRAIKTKPRRVPAPERASQGNNRTDSLTGELVEGWTEAYGRTH